MSENDSEAEESTKIDPKGQHCDNWTESGVFTYYNFDDKAQHASATGNVTGSCKLCPTHKPAQISGRARVSSNFIKHVRNAHKEAWKIYESEKCKRSLVEETSTSSKKQCKIETVLYSKPNKQQVMMLIMNYIIEEMKPLRTVECNSFIQLCKGLNPGVTVVSRATLTKAITSRYEEMIQRVISNLAEVEFVCTTADLWSSQNRSFLGLTVHWLNPNDLQRLSAAIACKRFKGSHTYDKIAKAIHATHVQYGIEYKVCKTCTDNGSNMVKAFNEFQVKVNVSEADDKQSDTEIDNTDESEDNEDDELDFIADHAVDTSNFLELNSSDDITLPPHMRCCTHTLNLVATTDAKKACDDKQYKKLYHSSMGKASAIWNLTSRSTKAADAAFEILGYRFQVPTVTRWNSFYESVSKIVKEDTKINRVCHALDLPHISAPELQFLKDYCAIVKPLSSAIDILQGEKNCYLGCVLPAIKSLITIIQKTPTSTAGPLKTAILNGLHSRFDSYFSNDEFILAAISHPKFKLYWVDDVEKLQYTRLLQTVCDQLAPSSVVSESDLPGAEEDQFFVLQQSSSSQGSSQCMLYLNDPDYLVSMLSRYPMIKSLFIKYNTVIPSSAPVERLFSAGSIILSTRRNKLSDETFEKLLLLRQNKKLLH